MEHGDDDERTVRPARVAIVGMSGHAAVVVDIARRMGLSVVGFYGDDESAKHPRASGWTRLGDVAACAQLRDASSRPWDALACAVASNAARQRIVQTIDETAAAPWATLVHPSAVVAPTATIGAGSVVCAGAVIGPGVRLGRHALVNTASSIDYECALGDWVHVSPGCRLCGCVEVEEGALIGTGTSAACGSRIGRWAVVGPGSVVLGKVSAGAVRCGVLGCSSAAETHECGDPGSGPDHGSAPGSETDIRIETETESDPDKHVGRDTSTSTSASATATATADPGGSDSPSPGEGVAQADLGRSADDGGDAATTTASPAMTTTPQSTATERDGDPSRPHRAAIVAVYKDAAPYLAEWIEYHRMLGFSHFYLYDDSSSDSHRSILDHYAAAGVATCHAAHGTGRTGATEHFLANHANEADWVLHIDTDEFVWLAAGAADDDDEEDDGDGEEARSAAGATADAVADADSEADRSRPAAGHPIETYLRTHEDRADAVFLNRLTFGACGHLFEPEGLVIENYLLRAPVYHPDTRWPKAFVRPERVERWKDAHWPQFRSDADGPSLRLLDGDGHAYSEGAIAIDEICLHHYAGKSLWRWLRSCDGGPHPSGNGEANDGGATDAVPVARGELWHRCHNAPHRNREFDAALLGYAGPLARRIAALPPEATSAAAGATEGVPRGPPGAYVRPDDYRRRDPRAAAFLERNPSAYPGGRCMEYLLAHDPRSIAASALLLRAPPPEPFTREGRRALRDEYGADSSTPDEHVAHLRALEAADLPDGWDWNAYLAANPDLGAAGISTRIGAVCHWLAYGWSEGRSALVRQ